MAVRAELLWHLGERLDACQTAHNLLELAHETRGIDITRHGVAPAGEALLTSKQFQCPDAGVVVVAQRQVSLHGLFKGFLAGIVQCDQALAGQCQQLPGEIQMLIQVGFQLGEQLLATRQMCLDCLMPVERA